MNDWKVRPARLLSCCAEALADGPSSPRRPTAQGGPHDHRLQVQLLCGRLHGRRWRLHPRRWSLRLGRLDQGRLRHRRGRQPVHLCVSRRCFSLSCRNPCPTSLTSALPALPYRHRQQRLRLLRVPHTLLFFQRAPARARLSFVERAGRPPRGVNPHAFLRPPFPNSPTILLALAHLHSTHSSPTRPGVVVYPPVPALARSRRKRSICHDGSPPAPAGLGLPPTSRELLYFARAASSVGQAARPRLL